MIEGNVKQICYFIGWSSDIQYNTVYPHIAYYIANGDCNLKYAFLVNFYFSFIIYREDLNIDFVYATYRHDYLHVLHNYSTVFNYLFRINTYRV